MTRPASAAEREHAIELRDLQRAVLGVIRNAAPSISSPERTAVLTEALTSAVLTSDTWCPRCQANRDSGVCLNHAGAVELADACRRHAYRQLPGRPRIDVDL